MQTWMSTLYIMPMQGGLSGAKTAQVYHNAPKFSDRNSVDPDIKQLLYYQGSHCCKTLGQYCMVKPFC